MTPLLRFWPVLLCGVLGIAAPRLHAQPFAQGFAFYLPPADTTTPAWHPVFPVEPLAADAFVSVGAGGHFTVTGTPVRFFGVNCTAEGCFPDKADAPMVAARMARYGINLLRLHFLDNNWGGRSLLERGGTRTLRAADLERLHYFIAQLKRHGVYVNVNLLVGRTFDASDGVAQADSLPEMAKGVALFDPDLLVLQQEYARQVLTEVNPYTGLALADDPVMAMVEIANENSLYFMWRTGQLRAHARGGALPQRHATLLADRFNTWLTTRYGDDAALRASWDAEALARGPSLLTNGGFEAALGYPWHLEQHLPAQAWVQRDAAQPGEGKAAARIDVVRAGAAEWHAQWKHVGLSVEAGGRYQVRFRARANMPRTVSASVMLDVSPWTWFGGETFALTPDWQTFSFTIVAAETRQRDVRLTFNLAAQPGSVWIDAVEMGAPGHDGLGADEALGSIRLLDFGARHGHTGARVADQTRFLVDTQHAFYAAMRGYLRDEIGVRVPISGTNWNFGLADLAVQHPMDYVDNHAYWQHPHWEGEPWTPTGWTIGNTPMGKEADGATIGALFGGVRALGKPYTVSEYNHPYPNQAQSEFPLFLGAYGAFHAADALMLYSYNHQSEWRADVQNQFFDLHRNTAVMALVPSIAYAYRYGLIAPAQTVNALRFSEADVARAALDDDGRWPVPRPAPGPRALIDRYDTALDATQPFDPSSLPPTPSPPYVSSTGQITWHPDGLLTVDAPRFAAMTGTLAEQAGAQAGPATLAAADGFATWTWLALDDAPLPQSRRSLLTLSTSMQNRGTVWNGTTSVENRWGAAPTRMRPTRIQLRLALDADSLRLTPLDPEGRPQDATSTLRAEADGTFAATLDTYATPTVWWAVEAFGNGTATARRAPASPPRFTVAALVPQPFSGRAETTLALASAASVTLALYDLTGRQVWERTAGLSAGTHTVVLDAPGLAPGVYALRVRAGTEMRTQLVVCR